MRYKNNKSEKRMFTFENSVEYLISTSGKNERIV